MKGGGVMTRFCRICDLNQFALVHRRGHAQFDHAYASRSGKRRARLRAAQRSKAPLMCAACQSGKHNGRRSTITCLEVVARPPKDFVCGCKQCKQTTPPVRLSTDRSAAEGVVAIDLDSIFGTKGVAA